MTKNINKKKIIIDLHISLQFMACQLTKWITRLDVFFVMACQFCGLFNAKAILEKQQWNYFTHSRGDEGVQYLPKGISQKVNIIAWLEFELFYFKATVHF